MTQLQPYKMIVAKATVVTVFLLSTCTLAAQHQQTNMFWLGYFYTVPLKKKWFVAGDLQLRSRNGIAQWSQQLIRAGVGYRFAPKWSVVAGGAWFRHATYAERGLFFRNEWRPWQELAYRFSKGRVQWAHRVRTEQRWIQQALAGKNTHSFSLHQRLRYKLEWQWNIAPKISPIVSNEFMVNPGEKSNWLDQNRTAVGIHFKTSAATVLQVQYINIWLWKNQSLSELQQVFRLNLVHQF